MSEEPQNPEIKRADFAREKGEVVLRHHEYDGIQEFDQKLPNWWLFTFYIAIVFFVVWWVIYYSSSKIPTDQEMIVARLQQLEENKQAALAETLAKLDDETLVHQWAADPAKVSSGETIYSTNCVACHGADLTGTMAVADQKIPLPGLPLTDGDWKYGAKPLEIFRIINEGTPPESAGHNGARMQAWGQMLTPQQVAEVTAFLIARNGPEFGL